MSNTGKSSPRESSVELLRIISAILIVFHHFSVHGGFDLAGTTLGISRFWYVWTALGGKIGVNVFVFISGYFLIRSSGFLKFRKLLKFWCQVFFYSVVIFLLFTLMGREDFTFSALLRNLMPLTFSTWWFASSYFMMYLLHPFMNRLLNALEKSAYQSLLLILLFCWSVIPTVTGQSFQCNSLLWFLTLYAVAGYVRMFGLNPTFSHRFYILSFCVSSALTFLFTFFSYRTTCIYNAEVIPVFLTSITLFMVFVTMKPKYSGVINVLGAATFGVYLIHDHPLVRAFLWQQLFIGFQRYDSILVIPCSILAVSAVFTTCTCADLLRLYLLEKPFMKLYEKYESTIAKPFKAVLAFGKNIIFGKTDNV